MTPEIRDLFDAVANGKATSEEATQIMYQVINNLVIKRTIRMVGLMLLFAILSAAVFCLVVLSSGCAHTNKGIFPAFEACMKEKSLPAVPELFLQVSNLLSHGSDAQAMEAQLVEFAGKAGQDAITCAVDAWLHPKPGAALNPAGVEAAKQFLAQQQQQ